ncbi:hypothetical protein MKX03_018559 [Papaver bracteatum]|nr:hypothetical protein MKX03_018559 [Papaver bracteatum]
MSKISRSINKLKKHILSSSTSQNLFSTTKNVIFLTRTLTSQQSVFSNSSSSSLKKIHNANFNSSHGGVRKFCSLRKEVEVKKHQSLLSVDNQSTHNLKRKDLWTSIPVRAYCLSPRIDLIGLMSENQANLIPHTPEMNNYDVLRFANTNFSNLLPNLEAKLCGSGYSYMVVFPYGSAVMFNMLDYEFGTYLKIIKRHALGLQPDTGKDCEDSFQHYIDYEVREKQDLATWMQGGLNCILLQQLNMDGICTLGSILGQRVALYYYYRLVDQWVKEYSSINYGLEERGSLSHWIELVKHTRRRSKDADIIYNFGLSERSDISWKEYTKYAQMLDYLRNEFEFTRIFAGLDPQYLLCWNENGSTLCTLQTLCMRNLICVDGIFTNRGISI